MNYLFIYLFFKYFFILFYFSSNVCMSVGYQLLGMTKLS